jgi:GTPase SAR1 family protein
MGEFLFLGPKGTGKSLLLRRMQTLSEEKRVTPFDVIPRTTPTETVEAIQFKHRQQTYTFKELGGSLVKDWAVHAGPAIGLVYVFDAADLTKTAANVVWLNDILSNSDFEQKPILIVLAKCDIPDSIRFSVIDEIIGFDRVLNPNRLSFLETSAVVGIGLTDIFKWVAEQVKPAS